MGNLVGPIIGAVQGSSKDVQESQQAQSRAQLEAERTAILPFLAQAGVGQTYQDPSGDNTLKGLLAGAEFGKQFAKKDSEKSPAQVSSAPAPASGAPAGDAGSLYQSGGAGPNAPAGAPGQDVEPLLS